MGLHFLAILPFRSQLLGSPPQVARNGPFAQRPYNGFISAVTGSILQCLAFWALISVHFGLVSLYFLAFWRCGLSFPFILALWAFISLHFGLVRLHFLAFWHCGPSFPCILALWVFISFYFGLVGLHFLFLFVLPSFPRILAFSGAASGVPLTSCKKRSVFLRNIQSIYQRQDRLHLAILSLLGLHFLSFWPCGPSFPCILTMWAFISLHFGFLGLHFLAFWPCGPSFPCILALWAFISFHFGLLGLHFLAFWPCGSHFLSFWPCGPSFPCSFALWAFISLHFGLVGLHFLSFWPCGPSFPCILPFWAFIPFHIAFISLHFGFFGISFWGPPYKLPKTVRFLKKYTKNLSAPGPPPFSNFYPSGPSFPFILALWAFISLHFGLVGLHFLAFWLCGLSFPCIFAL